MWVCLSVCALYICDACVVVIAEFGFIDAYIWRLVVCD